MLTVLIVALIVLTPALAAEKDTKPPAPQYENTGEPIALSISCTNDDLAAFGLICPDAESCPAYLELTSVDFVKGKLAVVGNLHGEALTLFSVLLVSDDGGLSWSEPYKRLRQAGLDTVHFYDEKSGWAVGHQLDGQPHDPFFLLTTDGGKYWRLRPVFDDGRQALVERFWFESDRSGGLLVRTRSDDGSGTEYRRYETMTGAESWMIREVSQRPISVRRPRMRIDNDWRVTFDEASGAWQVDKRDDAGWTNIARFAMEAGFCAAPVETVAEAAPPEEPKPEPLAPGEQPPLPDELPVAPGGVFVIGAPKEAPQPVEVPVEVDADRPKIKRPKP